MSEDIAQTLAAYIATDILHQPERILKTDQPLLSNGLVDSFSLVDLAMFVEDTFGVHLDDTELNKDIFDTLAQLAELIHSRQA